MPGPSASWHPRLDVLGAGRRLLLGGVLIGLLALQFLSGHQATGGHRVLSPAQTSPIASDASTGIAKATEPDRSPETSTMTAAGHTGGNAVGIVAGCALLLLAGVAVALAAAGRHRARWHRPALAAGGRGLLRGPPELLPRLALCVERI